MIRPARSVSAARKARSRRACRSTDRSPMLFKTRVPPSADRSPLDSAACTWLSCTAAQSTVTNGPSARPESPCTVRAIRDLPVPRSPAISNGDKAAATRGNAANSARIRVLTPIIPWFSTVSGEACDAKTMSDSDLRSSLIVFCQLLRRSIGSTIEPTKSWRAEVESRRRCRDLQGDVFVQHKAHFVLTLHQHGIVRA